VPWILGLFSSLATVTLADAQSALERDAKTIQVGKYSFTVQIPHGFTLEPLIVGLRGARMLTFHSSGDLFIGTSVGVVYRVPPPYRKPEILVALDDYPHSVAFRDGQIFIARTSGLYSAPYAAGQKRIARNALSLVAAIAGGAKEVINLDMASRALATGRRNHQLNFDPATCSRASYLAHDLFKSWGKLKRRAPYDIIIIDPPSNQGRSFYAEKDYAKILRRLPDLTGSDSLILACLNAPHLDVSFLTSLFADYKLKTRLPRASGFEDLRPQAALKRLIFRP
jgi:hypothetical protein